MVAKKDRTRRPKLGRTPAQERLWNWALGRYFDYIDEKQKLGGYPAEWQNRLLSEAKLAPEVKTTELLTELLEQFGMSIWAADPVRRPPEDESDDGEPPRAEDAPLFVERDEPEDDLFSVAGVPMPASFTISDAAVPGGYRRVGRRWGTWRIWDLHVRIEETKAAQSMEKAERDRRDCARAHAAIGAARIDILLWDMRDAIVGSSSGTHPRPTA